MILPASYSNGFAPRDGQPLYPGLWRNCVGAWAPGLGPTGLTFRDCSGFGNHGTLTNMDPGTDWVISGGRYALDFDGSDDYVNVPNPAALDFGTGDFTISLWAFMRSTTTGIIFSRNYFSSFEILSTGGYFQGYVSNIASDTSATFTLNTWTHVSLRRANGVSRMTLNGNNNRPTFSATASVSNGSDVHIGKRPGLAGFSPNAIMDDFRVYNRRISDSENILLARRRGIAYELAPRRRASVQVAAFNRRRRLLVGASS